MNIIHQRKTRLSVPSTLIHLDRERPRPKPRFQANKDVVKQFLDLWVSLSRWEFAKTRPYLSQANFERTHAVLADDLSSDTFSALSRRRFPLAVFWG